MFVSDPLVFLELQKTGCTHIAKQLARVLPGKQVGKHNRLPPHLADGKRQIVGSIRNPWDWYISLWAYGCDRRGALYHRLTSRKQWLFTLLTNPALAIRRLPQERQKPQRAWRNAYTSVDDPQVFREWLYLMFDADRKHDIGEGYGRTAISSFAGLLTFRYIYLYSRDIRELAQQPDLIRNLDDLRAFDRQNNVLDAIIRNEQLEDDLIDVLRQCGVNLTEAQIHAIRSAKKTNTSSRKRGVEYYYDRETLELVRSKDQFIIDKHGYAMPSL
ncbi:MAG TPA: hypothetical protein VFZ66_30060 [Herpetosiphonaceae bacterium]